MAGGWLVRFKNFFMDRCPKHEATAKNLVCKKSSSQSREKLENLLGGGGGSGIHTHGHQRVKQLIRLNFEPVTLWLSFNSLLLKQTKSPIFSQ